MFAFLLSVVGLFCGKSGSRWIIIPPHTHTQLSSFYLFTLVVVAVYAMVGADSFIWSLKKNLFHLGLFLLVGASLGSSYVRRWSFSFTSVLCLEGRVGSDVIIVSFPFGGLLSFLE